MNMHSPNSAALEYFYPQREERIQLTPLGKTWDEVYAVIREFSDFPPVRYEKCKAVYELAREIKEGVILELGTHIGLTAITMALANENIAVHTIDNFSEEEGWSGEVYNQERHATFQANVAQAGAPVISHVGDVRALAADWTLPIGMVYWDIYGYRLPGDFEVWQAKVLPGGLWATKDIDDNGFGHRALEQQPGWSYYRDYIYGLVYVIKKEKQI